MKIIVSQQKNKLLITFQQGNASDNYLVDKSEGFLLALDKFLKKNNIRSIGRIGQIRHIKFSAKGGKNIGMLTERVIRAIIAGLRF